MCDLTMAAAGQAYGMARAAPGISYTSLVIYYVPVDWTEDCCWTTADRHSRTKSQACDWADMQSRRQLGI